MYIYMHRYGSSVQVKCYNSWLPVCKTLRLYLCTGSWRRNGGCVLPALRIGVHDVKQPALLWFIKSPNCVMLQYNVTCFSTKSNFFIAPDLNYFPLLKSLTCKTIRNYFSKWSLCVIAWLSARSGTFRTPKDTEYLCEHHHAPIQVL